MKCKAPEEPEEGERRTRAWEGQGKLTRGGNVHGSTVLKGKKDVGS